MTFEKSIVIIIPYTIGGSMHLYRVHLISIQHCRATKHKLMHNYILAIDFINKQEHMTFIFISIIPRAN